MVAMANGTVATTTPSNATEATSFAFWTSALNADNNASSDGNSSSTPFDHYLANVTSTVSWLVNVTAYNASAALQDDFLDYSAWNQTYNNSGDWEPPLLNATSGFPFGEFVLNESTVVYSLLYNGSTAEAVTGDPSTMVDGEANVSTTVYGEWPGDSMYPSGHTMTHIVITAVLVTLLMIMVVVGNMLVIVAIVTEKALKTIQNWFIASLAVADFFLGLVVMPFSLAQELMGYWIFGFWWCEIHLAVDVLLCTSSIMNLCLISLDRYWSITQAVDYLKKRTSGRAAVMITAVWALSFLISVPPLLGWKKYTQAAEVPFCQVSDDTGYVIYSASGSFYIPSVIMVFVYVRIYFAARSRARRTVKKHRPALDAAKDKSTTTTSFSNASPPDKGKSSAPGTPRDPPSEGALQGPPAARPHYLSPPAPLVATIAVGQPPVKTCSSERTNGETTANNNSEVLEPLLLRCGVDGGAKPVVVAAPQGRSAGQRGSVRAAGGLFFGGAGSVKANGNSKSAGGATQASPSPNRLVSQAHALAQAQAQILLSDEMECLSELDHSSDSDQPPPEGRTSGLRRLVSLCNPAPKKPVKQPVVKADEIDLGRVVKPRDPEREKRRLARKKERRATLILGLIMASFILCWLPFFTLYVLRGLCKTCYINEVGFGLAFWLGYCNSALNPVIYTIFNKDFRKAFRKILFK